MDLNLLTKTKVLPAMIDLCDVPASKVIACLKDAKLPENFTPEFHVGDYATQIWIPSAGKLKYSEHIECGGLPLPGHPAKIVAIFPDHWVIVQGEPILQDIILAVYVPDGEVRFLWAQSAKLMRWVDQEESNKVILDDVKASLEEELQSLEALCPKK